MAYDGPPNFQELTLDTSYHTGDISAADTSIRVNEDLTGYPSTGYLTWERATPAKREITKWTNVNIGTKTFTVGRGGASGDGTTAKTHTNTATLAVTPNKGYFDDLEAEILVKFAAPPAIGNTTPAAGSFTDLTASTLSVSGVSTFLNAVGSNTTGVTKGFHAYGASYGNGFIDERAVTTAASAPVQFLASLAFSGSINIGSGVAFEDITTIGITGTASGHTGFHSVPVVGASATLAFLNHLTTGASNSGTITERNIICDASTAGTTQRFLKTEYASGGILSGVTTHDTESDEIMVNINGTTKYIKLYT